MTESPYEIIGIGAPICDYVLQVSEDFLQTVPGPKNGMQCVGLDAIHQLIQASGVTPIPVAGGSAANTLKGLAHLGHRTALVGKVGKDPSGDLAITSLRNSGVGNLLAYGQKKTTQVLCLVTPTGGRTFRTFLGASTELTVEDLKPSFFENARLVHIEGYTILFDGILEKAMELAKEAGAKLSFDLGSHELVSAHRSRILNLLRQFVDIIFCNRDELTALLNLPPERGCAQLRKLCETAVVLMGKEGCWIGREAEQHFWPAHTANTVDTTGAGDLFASGFLHGHLEGLSLKDCAHCGALLGSAVIQVVGADIPEKTWQLLVKNVLSLRRNR